MQCQHYRSQSNNLDQQWQRYNKGGLHVSHVRVDDLQNFSSHVFFLLYLSDSLKLLNVCSVLFELLVQIRHIFHPNAFQLRIEL
eukprot:m.180868 g.180868  ORF g.180868 m.180868 type:complete len:84 (+) comp14657_c0_seq5:3083-3334(+)